MLVIETNSQQLKGTERFPRWLGNILTNIFQVFRTDRSRSVEQKLPSIQNRVRFRVHDDAEAGAKNDTQFLSLLLESDVYIFLKI